MAPGACFETPTYSVLHSAAGCLHVEVFSERGACREPLSQSIRQTTICLWVALTW